MSPTKKKEKLLALLGILGFLLLNYPLLQIVNRDNFVIGVPFLFLYIFGVWVLAIIGLYAMSRRFVSPDDPPDKQEPEGHDQ